VDANSYFKHSLSEFIIIIEIAVVMVLGSMEDERSFSTVSFMKSKLRNRLTNNLGLVVAFKSQRFFDLGSFPYNTAYESWRDETKCHCDTK
jgi:hypothetical protein